MSFLQCLLDMIWNDFLILFVLEAAYYKMYLLMKISRFLLLSPASADDLCACVHTTSYLKSICFLRKSNSFSHFLTSCLFATLKAPLVQQCELIVSDHLRFSSQRGNLELRVTSSSKALSPKEWTSCLCLGTAAFGVYCVIHFCFVPCHIMKSDAKDENRRGGVTWLWYTKYTRGHIFFMWLAGRVAKRRTPPWQLLFKSKQGFFSLFFLLLLWTLVIWVYNLLFSASLTFFLRPPVWTCKLHLAARSLLLLPQLTPILIILFFYGFLRLL